MIEGIANFDGRTTSHEPGDAKGKRLEHTALRAAESCRDYGFGGQDKTMVRFVAARQAITDFLIGAEAVHVPTSDHDEELLIATGINPHTATPEKVEAAMAGIKERLLGHIALIQGEDFSGRSEGQK